MQTNAVRIFGLAFRLLKPSLMIHEHHVVHLTISFHKHTQFVFVCQLPIASITRPYDPKLHRAFKTTGTSAISIFKARKQHAKLITLRPSKEKFPLHAATAAAPSARGKPNLGRLGARAHHGSHDVRTQNLAAEAIALQQAQVLQRGPRIRQVLGVGRPGKVLQVLQVGDEGRVLEKRRGWAARCGGVGERGEGGEVGDVVRVGEALDELRWAGELVELGWNWGEGRGGTVPRARFRSE